MQAACPTSTISATAARAAALWALVPCAGQGSRAGTAQPKQYEILEGRPMVHHTLDALASVQRLHRIVVVVSPGDDVLAASLGRWSAPGPEVQLADCGGATRAQSVANGVQHLRRLGARDDDWVLVHDAARCLVQPAQIDRLIDACLGDAVGGLLAHRLADTLKQAGPAAAHATQAAPRSAQTLDRSDKWLAQTPQMFRVALLERALRQAGEAVTDEASAVEALGLEPLLVEGGSHNFKVTYADDFALARAVLRSRLS